MNDSTPDLGTPGDDARPSLLWRAAAALMEDAAILVFDGETRILRVASAAGRLAHTDGSGATGDGAADDPAAWTDPGASPRPRFEDLFVASDDDGSADLWDRLSQATADTAPVRASGLAGTRAGMPLHLQAATLDLRRPALAVRVTDAPAPAPAADLGPTADAGPSWSEPQATATGTAAVEEHLIIFRFNTDRSSPR